MIIEIGYKFHVEPTYGHLGLIDGVNVGLE